MPNPPFRTAPRTARPGVFSRIRVKVQAILSEAVSASYRVTAGGVDFGTIFGSLSPAPRLVLMEPGGDGSLSVRPGGVSVARAGGAGAVTGSFVWVTPNTAGDGAAGHIRLSNKANVSKYLWVDATGALRIGDEAPTESGSVSDTSGDVIALEE